MSSDTHGFNSDELEAPKWLNSDFMFKVLNNCEKTKEIEVINLNFSPATAKGDHYASVMFRVAVDYRLRGVMKQKSLIIKTMPEYEGNKKELLDESYIFETEIGMYTEVIPKMESILRAVGDETEMGPTCVYYALSPKKLIIFEDLVPKGYEVLRKRQINLEEAKATFAKIAKWHAVSYKLNLENPKYFDQYCHSVFSTKSFTESDSFQDGITNFIKILEETEDLRKYVPYFKPMADNILNACIDTFEEYRKNPQNSSYYVLCHGDFHCKNLMFKHNPMTKKYEEVLLLDYQFCYLGPIVNDLLYAKFMLLTAEQRTNHWDELIYFYFTTFQDTLKKIGFESELPKFSELKIQLMRHKHWEIFLFTSFLPLWVVISEGEIDFDKILESKDVRFECFRRPVFIDEVRNLLPKYLYAGYLEH